MMARRFSDQSDKMFRDAERQYEMQQIHFRTVQTIQPCPADISFDFASQQILMVSLNAARREWRVEQKESDEERTSSSGALGTRDGNDPSF